MSASSGIILRTVDGGQVWQLENDGSPYPLNSVAVDPLSGVAIAVGDRGTVLRRGLNGTWMNVSPPGVMSDLRSVAVGFDGVCMACGDSGTLISSFDSGDTWRVWEDFESRGLDLLSVNFDPSSSGSFVITGDEGFIYTSSHRTIDSGTFSPFIGSCVQLCSSFPRIIVSSAGDVYLPLYDSLHVSEDSLSFNSVTQVVSGSSPFAAVGDGGLVCTYLEGAWRVRETNCEENFLGIAHILYGGSLCAVGTDGTILISLDNGETWSPVSSAMPVNLNGVCGDGSGTGYIVGDSFLGRFFP